MRFLKNGHHLIPIDRIEWADYSQIEQLKLEVGFQGRSFEITGIDALESAMAMRPSVVEGKRLRWARHRWLVHNLVGHPLMQILALFRLYRAAFWVHDVTVPKPQDPKEPVRKN